MQTKKVKNVAIQNREKQLTSDTLFFLNTDANNAMCHTRLNVIAIGKGVFTLESLIHELNEKVISELLIKDFNFDNRKTVMIDFSRKSLSHFLSPYGEDSLIEPSLYRYGERAINENWLIEGF